MSVTVSSSLAAAHNSGSIVDSSEANRQWKHLCYRAAFPSPSTTCNLKNPLKSGILSVEPNVFPSSLMMSQGLGALSNPSQLYSSCSQPPAGPSKQDLLNTPFWALGSLPHSSSFNTEPQASASLPAFPDGNALAWPDEKDSSFFRTFGSTNGLGAVVLPGPELQQSLPGGGASLAMDTEELSCGSLSLERFSAVLGAGSQRQQPQLQQLPPAGPGSGAFPAAQPGLAEPTYGFMDAEGLGEPRMSQQGGLADGHFYDTDGVHTEELYQSFPFDNILQSYHP